MRFLHFICVTFLTSCTIGGIIPADGGAPQRDATQSGEEHLCIPEMTNSDFYHCGACGNACSVSDSDRCVQSECRCGIHEPCLPGSDCRLGFCIEADLSGRHCEFDEECDPGDACIEGFCSYLSCQPEVCDGVDNDCDGVIDGSNNSPLSEWCYSGGELSPLDILEPCSAGVRTCYSGEWTECLGELPPQSEYGLHACNNTDDNCDGCIDGILVDGFCESIITEGYDIVFIMDPSGSMNGVKSAVYQAARDFATTFAQPEFRWSIVTIPGYSGEVEVYQDFTDYFSFVEALNRFENDLPLQNGSEEPSYDALYQIGSRQLGLSFQESSVKIIIMFTDEGGQSFQFPEITEEEACSSLSSGEVFVYIDNMRKWEDFSCASYFFELSPDPVSMRVNLESVIQDPCLSEE